MSGKLLFFDDARDRVLAILDATECLEDMPRIYLVRSLFGRLGISVSEDDRPRCGDAVLNALDRLAGALHDGLGAYHARTDGRAVLWVDRELLDTVHDTATEIRPGVFWVDRLLVGEDWWTVGGARRDAVPSRYTLHSVKGGMGRSTTAAVLAWHLARQGEDVLVIDLDIESPGLASAVLDKRAQPTFGVTDWFVEELVGQGDEVLGDMIGTPAWAQDLPGNVWVAPAHGRDPGEYLAKLGRVYMDTAADPWTARLRRLLAGLETTLKPGVVLLESRSGLHDVAAATVTDVGADIMLFAVDSPSTWTGYGILFDHWRDLGLTHGIRDRLSIVSALTPELGAEEYVERFRENAWNLFRDRLYDPLDGPLEPSGAVSYDLTSEDAPHNPMVIRWNRGLAAGTSLRSLERTAVEQAYSPFLRRFERLHQGRPMGPTTADKVELRGDVGFAVEFEGRLSVNNPPAPETLRLALTGLPDETSHGRAPAPDVVYVPPSHRKALHPNVMLVKGMRGSGKTFWWSALQNPRVRTLLASLTARSPLTGDTEVKAGYGVIDAPEDYPGSDELRAVVESGIDPRLIWRAVHARLLADDDHPLANLESWLSRVRYVERYPDPVARLFRACDDALERRGIYSLVLFDGLDRAANKWEDMFSLIRGLLRHALDMRSYRRLRAKVFLRSDQADETQVATFADASKVFASSVALSWPRRDLYGMLWQYLANGAHGEQLRRWLTEGDWPTVGIDGEETFRVAAPLAGDEEVQRKRFHAMTGPWMGTDRRRGFPFTWIPNHLADAEGMVSPRSFIAALRAAADDTADRHPEHDHALHYDSVKRGVQEASRIRVGELREDYPWVDSLLGPLSGTVVPCEFSEIEKTWRTAGALDHLSDQIGQNDVKLPPHNFDRGAVGVREDLESLGVFRRLRDGRVDVPDVFRVGYGLGRRGGVRPVA